MKNKMRRPKFNLSVYETEINTDMRDSKKVDCP